VRDSDNLILENLYLELLLEKDHRQKIMSMGIPEDVANYLHNFNNKYSIWFADKIKDMGGFQYTKAKINWINVNILTQMQGIMDWVRNVPNVNLKQYTWRQAFAAQEEYHEKLQTATLEGQEDNTIIKKYDDGFYWVDLETTRDCSEQQLMGHCASTSSGDTLYSLRKYTPETQTIEAFITIAISPDDGIWYQCKGKRNSKPKEEYHPFIADILIDKKVFKYKHEYDSTHDFTNQDLTEYVENHRNEIPNADEILEQIEEGNVGYDDFLEILKEYQGEMDVFSLDIDSSYYDEADYVRVDGYFQTVIKYDEIDIPKIKEIIAEHGGEFYSYKDRDNLDNLLEKFDVYPSDGGDVRVEESREGNSFYVATYLDMSDDSHYQLNDNGLDAFRSSCQYYVNASKRFDKERFIEEFKIFALLEGWWSNEFSEFTDQVEETEYSNVVAKEVNKDYDFTIAYKPFANLLEPYKNYDTVTKQLGNADYLQHRDLSEEERDKYPYIQYLLDYFKYVFHRYLKIPEFSVKSVAGADWTIKIHEKFLYEDRKNYNLKNELINFKKIDDAYDSIKNTYYKLCNDIIIPMFESSRPMTSNDVYWKKEEYDAEIEKLRKDVIEQRYSAKSINLPVYDKETNKEITIISLNPISTVDMNVETFDLAVKKFDPIIISKIDIVFHNAFRKYPKYNKTLIENFIKENFARQLTFKDYLARK
jgi:hypothetical protein